MLSLFLKLAHNLVIRVLAGLFISLKQFGRFMQDICDCGLWERMLVVSLTTLASLCAKGWVCWLWLIGASVASLTLFQARI